MPNLYSERTFSAAQAARRQAERLAGVHDALRLHGPLSVPPEWTAWLLMEKAGVPRELIADAARVNRERLNARLRLTKVMMVWAPYAARIERLMGRMPPFAAQPEGERQVKEAACAALAE